MQDITSIIKSTAQAEAQQFPTESNNIASLPPILNEQKQRQTGLSTSEILKVWVQMLSIYGHKWASINGDCPVKPDLTLTVQGAIWKKNLSECNREMISRGFAGLRKSYPKWPPTLFEFLELCQGISEQPSISEVAYILQNPKRKMDIVRDTGTESQSLVDLYTYPIVLAIKQSLSDSLASKTKREAEFIISPIYHAILKKGAPEWPEGAYDRRIELPAPKVKRTDEQNEYAKNVLKQLRKNLYPFHVKKILSRAVCMIKIKQ